MCLRVILQVTGPAGPNLAAHDILRLVSAIQNKDFRPVYLAACLLTPTSFQCKEGAKKRQSDASNVRLYLFRKIATRTEQPRTAEGNESRVIKSMHTAAHKGFVVVAAAAFSFAAGKRLGNVSSRKRTSYVERCWCFSPPSILLFCRNINIYFLVRCCDLLAASGKEPAEARSTVIGY